MATLYISTGTNDADCDTKATTEAGYVEAARRLCGAQIGAGLHRLRIKIVIDGVEAFSAVRDVIA